MKKIEMKNILKIVAMLAVMSVLSIILVTPLAGCSSGTSQGGQATNTSNSTGVTVSSGSSNPTSSSTTTSEATANEGNAATQTNQGSTSNQGNVSNQDSTSLEGSYKVLEGTYGQAQKGAAIVFSGGHCNLLSPNDTYAFNGSELTITGLLGGGGTFNVTFDGNKVVLSAGSTEIILEKQGQ